MSEQRSHEEDTVMRALGRIEGKLEEIGTLPTRVRSLENWRSMLIGGWIVVSLIVSYIVHIQYGR